MQRSIFVCDVCSAEQSAANHWFAVVIEGRRLTLVPLTGQEQATARGELFHLCGEACVARKVSEFLGAAAK